MVMAMAQVGVWEGELEVNDRIIAEREEEALKILRGAEDVHEVFRDLAKLVEEQTPGIERIAENIQATKVYTERGVRQLKKADQIHKDTPLCTIM